MKIHVVRERPKQKLNSELEIGKPCIKCHRPITKEVVEHFQEIQRIKGQKLGDLRRRKCPTPSK